MIPRCSTIILGVTAWILSTIAVLGANTPAASSSVELVCQVGFVSTLTGNQNIVIPVYLTNVYDSVDAFQLWITSSDVNIMRFAADSVGGVIYGRVDTTGTRSRGGSVTAYIVDPLHGIIKIEGHFSPERAAIPPGSGILFKLIAETNGTSDSAATVELSLDRNQSFFSKPDGHLFGCVYDTLGECTIDTTKLVLIDGEVEVEVAVPPTCICGDANGDGIIDVSDVVCLIAYIFPIYPIMECTPVDCLYPRGGGDANGDGIVDISDGVNLIAYIFSGGPVPHCYGH